MEDWEIDLLILSTVRDEGPISEEKLKAKVAAQIEKIKGEREKERKHQRRIENCMAGLMGMVFILGVLAMVISIVVSF